MGKRLKQLNAAGIKFTSDSSRPCAFAVNNYL